MNALNFTPEAEKVFVVAKEKIRTPLLKLYHGALQLKREVSDVVKIPGTTDFLVITDDELDQINVYNNPITIAWGKPGTSRKKSIFVLTNNQDILVPHKVKDYHGKVYEIPRKNKCWKIAGKTTEEKFIPQPIYSVTLFESRTRDRYSATDSYDLIDRFWEGYDYTLVIHGDKEYRLNWIPVIDPDVTNIVDEYRAKKEDSVDYSISFEKYSDNKIIVKQQGRVVEEIDLRVFK